MVLTVRRAGGRSDRFAMHDVRGLRLAWRVAGLVDAPDYDPVTVFTVCASTAHIHRGKDIAHAVVWK